MHKFLENLKPTYGVFSSALGGESGYKAESTLFVDMKNYNNAVLYGMASGASTGQVISLIALEATDTAGNGSATTSKTDVFTATATNHTDLLQVEIKAEELSAGYQFVGIRMTTDDTSGTEKVSGMIVQGAPRYAQAVLP